MPVSDLSIDYANRLITRPSGTDTFTARAVYSWLQDQIDELVTLTRKNPMTAQTPTDFTLVNGYMIEESVYKYITGGSVQTLGWDAATFTGADANQTFGIYVLTFTTGSYTNAVAGDIGKTVVNGSTNGTLLAYDNAAKKWWVRRVTGSTWSNATTSITTGTGGNTGGAPSAATGEALYSNVYSLPSGALESGTQQYVEQNGAILTTYWGTGHIDLVLKVKEAGTLIDSGLVRVFAREYTDNYFHVQVDLSAGGRNPVGTATTDDTNNQTASGTVATWSDVTITFGTTSKNLNNGNGAKNYDVVIDGAGRTVAQIYERLKYVTRRGETALLNGVQGQRYRSANGAYADSVASPFGTFAGGKFFGARGVWIEDYNAGDAKNFQLIAADGTTQIPPNVVGVTVGAIISGDRVGVYRLSAAGGAVAVPLALAAGNNSGNSTLVMSGAIPSDTPAAGVVSIVVNGNTIHSYSYTSWTGSTFTLSGTLSQSYSAALGVFVPLIQAQSSGTSVNNTLTYSADIPVLIVVRRATGGTNKIVPFAVEGTVGSTGLSVNAIRNQDTISTNA
jgi:hypothetical protein